MTHKIFTKIKKIIQEDESKYGILLIVVLTVGIVALCFVQHVTPDSAGYLRETLLITQCLKKGEWFGNYAVGIHGFLFKIPVALLFLFTGPSVIVASLFNAVLTVLALTVFYIILTKRLHLGHWAVFGLFLLTFNYRFLISSITYLREVPMLLSVLLFIEGVLAKRNKWLIGLYLLMVFDAKEYMFFALVPVYIIWGIIYEYPSRKNFLSFFKKFGDRMVAGFLPSVVMLYLMFFTSLAPANMFAATIVGLAGSEDSEISKLDIVVQANTHKESLEDPDPQSDRPSSKRIDFRKSPTISYLLKIISTKSFSFESVSLSIFLPSMLISIIQFIRWKKNKEVSLLILPLTLCVFLVFYFLRLGRVRYIFPIIPIISVFFIYFLRENNKKIINTLIGITAIIVSLSYFSESDYPIKAVGLNALFLILICVYFSFRAAIVKWDLKKYLWVSIPIFSLVLASLIATLTPYIKDIRNQTVFGLNFETGKIVHIVSPDDVVWINGYLSRDRHTELLQFYREDTSIDPEWYATLLSWVPKKTLQKSVTPNTYMHSCKDLEVFKQSIFNNKVEKLIVVKSMINEYSFPDQGCVEVFKKLEFLRMIGELSLKNKTVYVFEIHPYE